MDPKSLHDLLYRALAREPKGSGRAIPPVAWASTRGQVRAENQDRLLVARSPAGMVMAIVADGMGGMRDGSQAAALSAAAVAARCMVSQATALDAMLADALHFANDEVFRVLHGQGGAALVVAASSSAGRYIAHVGDARAYHVDDAGHLAQLTVDDTVAAQLKCLGKASSTEANSDNRLLQFVGFGAGLEPHVRTVPTDGRALLLTTDGIYGVPTSVLEWVVNGTGRLQLLAERLTIASEWNGGHDNATVVAVSFGNESGIQGPHGTVEFWVPGQHLVVAPTPDKKTPAAEGALSTQEPPKSRPTKKRRATKSRRKPPVTHEGASTDQAERQLPIVTFEDDHRVDDGLASKLQASPLVEEDREPRKPRTK